jgi:MFS family permease
VRRSSRASGRARTRAAAAGVALGFTVGTNVANIGAVATSLEHAYGTSLGVIGLFTTALFVTHTAGQIPGGRAVDRFGARRLGFAALAIVAAGNALAMIASDPALALAARALTGVGTGIGFIAGSEYVRAAGGTALAQGVFGGVGVAGGGFALAVVPQLETAVGWRAPFMLALSLTGLAACCFLAWPLPSDGPPRRTPVGASALDLLGDRRLYRLAAMHAASFGISVVVGNWTVTLLERHGYGTSLASALGAVTLSVSVVSRPLGGWIVRRAPRDAALASAASLAAGAAATAGLALSGPVALAVLSATMVGVAAGIPFALVIARAVRARPDAPAAAIGLINMCASLLIVAATPLVGLTFSLPGRGRIGFVALAALWGLALLALPPRAPFEERLERGP